MLLAFPLLVNKIVCERNTSIIYDFSTLGDTRYLFTTPAEEVLDYIYPGKN